MKQVGNKLTKRSFKSRSGSHVGVFLLATNRKVRNGSNRLLVWVPGVCAHSSQRSLNSKP
jgi:hypothetical protein